jgi:hypothetical protein
MEFCKKVIESLSAKGERMLAGSEYNERGREGR